MLKVEIKKCNVDMELKYGIKLNVNPSPDKENSRYQKISKILNRRLNTIEDRIREWEDKIVGNKQFVA